MNITNTNSLSCLIKNSENIDNIVKYLKKINLSISTETKFNSFFKEMKLYLKADSDKESEEVKHNANELFESIIVNKPKIIIFNLSDDEEENDNKYGLNDIIIPFTNFFISSNVFYKLKNNEIINIFGIYVFNTNKNMLGIFYLWANILQPNNIHYGFDILNNHALLKEKIKEIKEQETNELELSIFIVKKIHFLIKKLLSLTSKKEYTTYHKWTSQGLIKKEIVYAYDVRAHKRHFWEDSGRFKIPLMTKEG